MLVAMFWFKIFAYLTLKERPDVLLGESRRPDEYVVDIDEQVPDIDHTLTNHNTINY